ncbi:proline-rich 33 kDa extensin-related protein-like [Neltuma alba]|uniref:proline-rich 33 kDa extensin-related protein-like n=1 Tax=Neltuma alba TaxID=207710 RepID=UPI0010A4AFD7|nr:proline-rich 33 kDa extensin-related protein-like [Prosopis alba]
MSPIPLVFLCGVALFLTTSGFPDKPPIHMPPFQKSPVHRPPLQKPPIHKPPSGKILYNPHIHQKPPTSKEPSVEKSPTHRPPVKKPPVYKMSGKKHLMLINYTKYPP